MRKLTLAAVLLALVHAAAAAAESEGDAKVAQLREEHPELGFLFFEVTILRDSRPACTVDTATLTSNTGKRALVDVVTGSLFPRRITRGALASLEPAVWTIALVKCINSTFVGPFAQIRIEPGAIVNAGNLVVDVYTIRPKGLFNGAIYGARATVEDLPAASIESLQARAPATFAKAKRRYFATSTTPKQAGPAPASPATR
jgi:hypothetical protein